MNGQRNGMTAWAAVLTLGAVLGGAIEARGQERDAVTKKGGAPVVVSGENVCVGCTLKKEQGAAAQCSVYGHTHALRVERAAVDGKAAPELKNRILHYLPNSNSEDLIKLFHGEKLTLTGRLYQEAQVLEVDARSGKRE